MLGSGRRHVLRLGGGLQGPVEPPEPVGGQLLAAHTDVGEAPPPRVARQVAGLEGVDVDEPLEVVVMVMVV